MLLFCMCWYGCLLLFVYLRFRVWVVVWILGVGFALVVAVFAVGGWCYGFSGGWFVDFVLFD